MYSYDLPEEREGLYAAFVGSTEALAIIKGIDASEALKVPGVVDVLDAKDVPGENKSDVEEVFASKKVRLDAFLEYEALESSAAGQSCQGAFD